MSPEFFDPSVQRQTRSPEQLLILAACGILGALFVWFQWRLLLLCFAGLLISIVLHSAASWVARRTRLKQLPSYLITLLALAALTALAGLLLVPRAVSQLSQVAAELPHALRSARGYLQGSLWGSSLLDLLHRAMLGTGGRLTLAAKDSVQFAVDLLIVVVIGFFGALNPAGYRNGLLSVIPERHRGRARQLSAKIAAVLRSWLLGQLVPMAVLGICSMIGLSLLGVPLAFTLGLMTGIMIFMPYVGSIISGLLAILLALQVSPHTALYVFLLYCGGAPDGGLHPDAPGAEEGGAPSPGPDDSVSALLLELRRHSGRRSRRALCRGGAGHGQHALPETVAGSGGRSFERLAAGGSIGLS